MIKKNIFRSLLIVASLAFLYACSSPAGPVDALKKYAGTWEYKSGKALFTIDGDGNISSTFFEANKINQESYNKFVIEATAFAQKGTVTIVFDTDTTATASLNFTVMKREYKATKK